MGRPPKPADEKRTERLLIQLTPEEKRELTEGAEALGIPAGEVFRRGGFRYLRRELARLEEPPEPPRVTGKAAESGSPPSRRKRS